MPSFGRLSLPGLGCHHLVWLVSCMWPEWPWLETDTTVHPLGQAAAYPTQWRTQRAGLRTPARNIPSYCFSCSVEGFTVYIVNHGCHLWGFLDLGVVLFVDVLRYCVNSSVGPGKWEAWLGQFVTRITHVPRTGWIAGPQWVTLLSIWLPLLFVSMATHFVKLVHYNRVHSLCILNDVHNSVLP